MVATAALMTGGFAPPSTVWEGRYRWRPSSYQIRVTEDAKELLIDESYDPAYGARPLRRAITQFIEDRLATKVLDGALGPDSIVVVATSYDPNLKKRVFTFTVE